MQYEHSNGRVNAGGVIAVNASLAEVGALVGVYHAINIGPLEQYREEYTELSLEIDRFISKQEFATAKRLQTMRSAIPLEEKWRADAPNHVTTEGANLALDTFLAGSGYTVTGPYMGLISSVSYTTTAIGDTAAQINGTNQWKEAGSSTNFPLYTTPRKTAAWSSAAAKSKALSAALSFAIITTGGTVKGAILLYGTGATSTTANTSGTLYSAGVFTGGDKIVAVSDTLNVSYSASM